MTGVTAVESAGVIGDELDRLFQKRAASELLGVSERTIDRMRHAGSIPFVRIGRRVLFRGRDLATIQRDGTVRAGQ